MKITKEQLIKIINEEISLVKGEGGCSAHNETQAPMLGIASDDVPCGCPDMAHYHNNDEGSMSRSQLMHMKGYAEELMHMISDQDDLPEWVEKKITLANDYIAKVKHYLEGEMAREQGMLEDKKK